MSNSVEFTDNSGMILEELTAACERALEECGLTGERYAKQLCPTNTGNLHNSITHKVDIAEKAVYIGTDIEYAPYVELGTGKYAQGGRRGFWVYVKGGSSKGHGKGLGKTYTKAEALRIMYALRKKNLDAHITDGRKAIPFLKPAIDEHRGEYAEIVEDELSKE